MFRWCVFISGRGSNLAAAIEECRETGPSISLVVSSDENAVGLAKARRAGIATMVTPKLRDPVSGKNKIDWVSLDRALRAARIDGIFLLGFMRIVPADFLESWKGKVWNLHPSLLPSFPGLRSIERAFEAHAPLGATIHVVEPEVDAGPIVKQAGVVDSDLIQSNLAAAEFFVHQAEQILVRGMFSRHRFMEEGRG